MNRTQLICAVAIATLPLTAAFADDAPVTAPDAEAPKDEETPPADESESEEPEPEAAPPADGEAAMSHELEAQLEKEMEAVADSMEDKIESIAAGLGSSQVREFEKDTDGWFRPVIGGRWLPGGNGGATVLGISGGSWHRLNKEDSKIALGLTSRARYEGAIGDARGRVLKTDGRFTFHTSILRVEAGGGLEASRSKFETAPQLSGVLGAVADTRVKVGIEEFNVLLGARPMWILTGDRESRTEGPVGGVGDELSHILGANFFFLSATWTRTYTSSGPIEQVIAGFEI